MRLRVQNEQSNDNQHWFYALGKNAVFSEFRLIIKRGVVDGRRQAVIFLKLFLIHAVIVQLRYTRLQPDVDSVVLFYPVKSNDDLIL